MTNNFDYETFIKEKLDPTYKNYIGQLDTQETQQKKEMEIDGLKHYVESCGGFYPTDVYLDSDLLLYWRTGKEMLVRYQGHAIFHLFLPDWRTVFHEIKNTNVIDFVNKYKITEQEFYQKVNSYGYLGHFKTESGVNYE